MAKARTLVGLDVHAAKVVAAILDAETGELRFQRLGGESGPVVELCRVLPGPVRATYEQPARRPRSLLDGGPHDETRSCGHPDPRISA
jgi:hypothetical protein